CKSEDVDWEAYVAALDPNRSFDPRLLREWQLFRACTSGPAGLWMPHMVDLLHMITGRTYPLSAVSQGGVYIWKDGRETPDTFTSVLEYPEGSLFDWTMDLGAPASVMKFVIQGNRGTLDVQNGILETRRRRTGYSAPERLRPEPSESHMGNWLACIRTRRQPNADVHCGHQHAIATIMADLAMYSGRRERWNAEEKKIVPE